MVQSHSKGQSGASFDAGFLAEKKQDGRGVFRSSLKPEPCRKGDAADFGDRNSTKIDSDQSETASLQQQVRGFERLVEVPTGTDPQQSFEIDPKVCGGCRIKGGGRVD